MQGCRREVVGERGSGRNVEGWSQGTMEGERGNQVGEIEKKLAEPYVSFFSDAS